MWHFGGSPSAGVMGVHGHVALLQPGQARQAAAAASAQGHGGGAHDTSITAEHISDSLTQARMTATSVREDARVISALAD